METTGANRSTYRGRHLRRRAATRIRHHVRRELEQRGTLRLRRVSRPRREELDTFYELEASGWKGEERSAILADSSTRQFYAEIAQNAGQLNYLSMYFLELDDQLLAAHLGLSYGRTYYSPKLAYNEAFKEFAPGHLIISEIVKDLAARGIDMYDITGPDDQWKMRWTSEVRPRFQQLIFNKGILGQMAHSVGLRMNIHFPRDLTLSTVLPATGASTSTLESLGRTVSKPVTSWPASALLSVREARNIVSPSGIRQSPRTLRPYHRDRHFLRCQSDWHFHLVLRLEQFAASGTLRLNLQIPRQ